MEPRYQDEILMQKQLSLQILAQLQHQRNICEIIFSTLASAEKVALKLSRNKEYKLYDPLNSSSFKNEIQLENELANKLVYLQAGLIAFKLKHGDFIFPDGNIKKEMITDIQKWSKLIKKNRPKAMESYKTLLELINGSTKEIPNNCFHQYDVKPDEKSTLGWAEGLMFQKINLNNQNKEVQNDYEETGTHQVPFQKQKNDEVYPKNYYDIYNEYIQAEKKTEKYLEILLKEIGSNNTLTLEQINEMWNLINKLNNSLDKVKIDENIIYKKKNFYQEKIKNANAMFIQYYSKLLSIYDNNLKK